MRLGGLGTVWVVIESKSERTEGVFGSFRLAYKCVNDLMTLNPGYHYDIIRRKTGLKL